MTRHKVIYAIRSIHCIRRIGLGCWTPGSHHNATSNRCRVACYKQLVQPGNQRLNTVSWALWQETWR